MITTSARWVIGTSLTMAAAMGIGRFVYTPMLPLMSETYAWTFSQAGDVASANFLGYLVGAILAPRIAHAPQVRFLVALSLMGSVGTTYLGAEVSSFGAWLIVRFASGVASAFCLVVLTTHLLETLARERSEHLGNIHFAGVGLGIIICVGGYYLGGSVEQQWARQGGIAAAFMAIAWFALSPGPWLASKKKTEAGSLSGDEKASLWRLTVGYGFFGFGYVVSATFIVSMAATVPSFSDPALVWIVVGAATIPSVYAWQWLANRYNLLVALALSYLVLSVGVFLAGWGSTLTSIVLAAVLLGGTFGGVTALGLSAGRAVAPKHTAYAVSSMTVAFSLGQLLGPAVAGRMADAFGGFFWPSALCAVLLIISVALLPRSRTALR